MRRRNRFIASAFTALAFSLSLGESVVASACAPAADAPADHMTDATSPPDGTCCGPAGQKHGDHRDATPCPFGTAAGAFGCATAASLPAHTTLDLALSPESAIAVVSDGTQHSLSFSNALFRPPKP